MVRPSILLSKLIAAALAAGVIFGSCTGLERARSISETDRVSVSFRQEPSKKRIEAVEQTLVTPSVLPKREVETSNDPMLKVLGSDGMQVLLDGLATAGFFENARNGTQVRGVSSLIVKIGPETLAWTFTRDTYPEEYAAYQRAVVAFLEVYNGTTSYRSARGTNSLLRKHREQRNLRGERQ